MININFSRMEDITKESYNKSTNNYKMIDIGANLTHKKFSRDLNDVIQRAQASGVIKIMVTGTSIKASKEAIRLSRLYPDILYATVGVHPHEARLWDEQKSPSTLSILKDLASNPECVAIGECGLDYNRNFSSQAAQLQVFEKQLKIACELQKPLFLHEREAHQDMVGLLEKYKMQETLPKCVIHCFTGTVEEVTKYLDIGCYIGLTGYLWKDQSQNGVRKALMDNLIPLDRLLIETDAPFMYPNINSAKLPENIKSCLTQDTKTFLHSYCSFQRNEPCSLPVTLEMISAFMDISLEDIAIATTHNVEHIFGIT